MRALITGGAGFVGQHLAEYLGDKVDVTIADLHLGWDVRDYEHVRRVIDEVRPDYIYHLAAVTSIPEAIADPQRTIDTNLSGTLNILEAMRRLGLAKTKTLLVSSTEAPVANNPYGTTKLAMEQLGQFYAKSYGMHIVCSRTSNHAGPGQHATFAVASFAKQVALIENGKQDELRHGDLDVWKHYLDVRDVVAAYEKVINLPPDVYTIASVAPVTMQAIVDGLVGLAKTKVKTSVDESQKRPYKQEKIIHRTSEAVEVIWQPQYSLGATLLDTLDYWRGEVL